MTLLGQMFRKYSDTNNCIMWEKNKKSLYEPNRGWKFRETKLGPYPGLGT